VRPQHQTRIGLGSQSRLQRFSGGEALDGTRGGELRWRSRTEAPLGTGVDRRHEIADAGKLLSGEITKLLSLMSLLTRFFHFVSTSSLNRRCRNRLCQWCNQTNSTSFRHQLCPFPLSLLQLNL